MISIINIIGFCITILVIAFVIVGVYLIVEVNDIKRKIDGFYSSYNDMFSRINGLYKEDAYGTERPKVDVLQNWFENSRSDSFDTVEKIEDRLDKLEKNK